MNHALPALSGLPATPNDAMSRVRQLFEHRRSPNFNQMAHDHRDDILELQSRMLRVQESMPSGPQFSPYMNQLFRILQDSPEVEQAPAGEQAPAVEKAIEALNAAATGGSI